MIDERAEFAAYTGVVVYDAKNKQDSAYLGRLTFDTLLRGEGLQRILTIVARGYLWQTEKPDIDRARDALRAWCSIPDSKKAKPKEAWQYETISGSFTRHSRSWWTTRATAGLPGMSTVCGIFSNTTRRR